jgi:ankyrin repeat protein
METRSKRRETEPVVDKIRRGEISVFVAVAEELPEVFRTHVVAKLDLISTLRLAQVNKYYNAAVWSVEAMESMDKKQKVHVAAELGDHTAFPLLIVFALTNNTPGLRTLLSTGVDLSQKCQGLGITALLHAASAGSLEAVNLLLEAGADVNERCDTRLSEQITPLVMAIQFGHAAVVSALLEAEADVELKSELNRDGDPEIRTALYWETPLITAAYYENDEEIMKLLLDAGANPNIVMHDHDPDMMTLLHALAEMGDGCVNTARLLLEAGADPSAINVDSATVSGYLLERENPKMAALLKEWMGLDDSE